jgi:S-DNA-T family DNA segregation ATPase FtsK/SpoIIIE
MAVAAQVRRSPASRATSARAPAPQASARLASPAIRTLIGRRVAEITGLALAMAGIGIFVALATYNPRDPSLNTATSQHATNLAGPAGSVIADFLLQGFGVACVLPPLAMLVWAWRIASRAGLGNPWLRVLFTAIATPSLATVFTVLAPHVLWPTGAGLGGAGGSLMTATAMDATVGIFGTGWFAPVGAGLTVLAAGFMAIMCTVAGFGISLREWRRAGDAAAVAARAGIRAGTWSSQQAAGLVSRSMPAAGSYEDDEDDLLPEQAALVPHAAAALRQTTTSPTVAPQPVLARPVAKPRVAMPEKRTQTARQESLPLVEAGWRYPPMTLLKSPPPRAASGPSEDSLQNNARLLESVLAEYGVQGTIREIRPGPVVTLYELEPAPGIRSARVIGLADDVARSMSVTAVRIATVPGRNVIGIEVPNARRETVFLAELLESEAFQRNPARLPLALGKDIGGAPIIADLARMPHLLIAGTTGSGKSVGINAMILSLLYRLPPDQCRLILIDPKMLELSVYEGIPHLMAPVVTEPAKAVSALKWTVREMERRYRNMSQLGVRNVGGYNERVEEARNKGEVISRRVQTGYDSETGKPTFEEQPLTLEPLPFIVVVIDEMADLMMVAGKDIEAAVQRLAQMARAAGIHVIMATQRPSVDVITGTIKANFPTRISFQVISKFDSRTILGEQGSEQLLGHGDMLYMMGGGRITRVHGPLVTDREVEDIVAYLRTQGEPAYLDEVTDGDNNDPKGGGDIGFGVGGPLDGEVGLFDQAVALVAREGKASTSFIQRHLNIGYNRAAKLIEQMEKEGIVSAANHVGKREVLVRRTDED